MHGHCVVLWNQAVEDIMLCMRNGILMEIAMYITVVDVMVRKRGGWQVYMCPATGMEGSPAAAKIARQLTADKSNVKRKPSPH